MTDTGEQGKPEAVKFFRAHWVALAVCAIGVAAYIDVKLDLSQIQETISERSAGDRIPVKQVEAIEPSTASSDGIAKDADREPSGSIPEKMEAHTQRYIPWQCDGSIAHDSVMKTIGESGQAVFGCYKQMLVAEPKLSGTIIIDLKIGSNGQVTGIQTTGDIHNSDLVDCVREVAGRWTFSTPQGGDCAVIEVPFMLKPEDHLPKAIAPDDPS